MQTKPGHPCLECGTIIEGHDLRKKFCPACTEKHRVHQWQTANSRRQERHRQRAKGMHRHTTRSTGREYAGQLNSPDGKSYLINFGGKWVRIPKVCKECRRNDTTVRGEWAPIYSETDEFGRETKAVLLCLYCYDELVEGYQWVV